MKTHKLAILSLGAALSLSTIACGVAGDGNTPPTGDDDTSSSTSPSSSDDDADSGDGDSGDGDSTSADDESTTTTAGPDGCHDPIEGGLEDGEICVENEDCASNFCVGYSDAPNDPEATCQQAPNDCLTRVVGQVLEFGTNEAISGIDIKVTGAIAASVNPVGATALADATTDEMGRFDMTTDEQVEQPLGIVGIVTGDGYHLSATGLASPLVDNFYGPGNAIRDMWAVPLDTLGGWNAALAGDVDLEEELPLGDKGGVIGLARSAETGEPTAGITIVSVNGDGSNAIIRYLNDAGDAFDNTTTGASGIFIIVNPGLGENFDALLDGEMTAAPTGTAGSTNSSLFIMIMGV